MGNERENASEAVKDCAESVKRDNPDLSKSQAFAICQSMENEGKLADVDDNDSEDVENERENSADVQFLAEGRIRKPDKIERVDEGDGVRYKNVAILSEGVWTDAASRETIHYAADAIQNSVDNWDNTTLNLFHDQDEISEVGEVDESSVYADEDGTMYADLVMHADNGASQYAIDLMDKALETGGAEGIGGPSVEIVDDVAEFDEDRGLEKMVEMTFGGVGLVENPASKTVDLANQTRSRAVAMADGDAESKEDVRIMTQENENEKELQVNRDSIQEAVGDIADEAGMPVADIFDMLSPILDEEGNENDEDEQEEEMQKDEDEEDGEEPEEQEQEQEQEDEGGESSESAGKIADMIDKIADRLDELEERIDEIQNSSHMEDVEEKLDELDKRMSDIEDEPDRKGLTAIDDGEDDGSEVETGGYEPTHDGYISAHR